MRDSGLDISATPLREAAIKEKRQSWVNASDNSFNVGTIEDLVPTADLVLNLTPDKQHTPVIERCDAPDEARCLPGLFSHGFNIVEEGMQIRDDLTVIMVAPQMPRHGSARGIQARLRCPDPDCCASRKRPQWRWP